MDSKLGFNGLLVLFTAALVWVGAWQARRLREAVEATNATADAMKRANTLTEANAIASERPWIGISSFATSNAEIGQIPRVTFILHNFGKSPGFEARYRTGLGIANSDLTVSGWIEALNQFPVQEIGTWFPTQGLTSRADLKMLLTAEMMNKLESGEFRLYAFGKITCKDRTLQVEHTTWISGLFYPGLKAIIPERFLGLPLDT